MSESDAVEVFSLDTKTAHLSEAGVRAGKDLGLPTVACRNQGLNLSLQALSENNQQGIN